MVSIVDKEEDRVNQRLKRLLQRFAQARLASTFTAWRDEAEFERSVHALEYLLAPCDDVFDYPPHERSEAAVSAVLQLLHNVPLFAGLCGAAQRCIATHAKLLVLSDTVEMPTCEEDSSQLYSVLCGSISSVHGDLSDPQLQQLLANAKQQQADEETAAAAAAVAAEAAPAAAGIAPSPSKRRLGGTSASNRSSRTNSRASRESSSWFDMPPTPSQLKGSRARHGIWHRVKAAVSAGQKRRIHSSMAGHQPQPQQQQPQDAALAAAAAAAAAASSSSSNAAKPATPLSARSAALGDAECLVLSVSVGAAAAGHSFCGSKFTSLVLAGGSVSAGLTSDDAMSHAAVMPSSCLAAVAEPNSVAALLVVSKPAYMEACRIHHEVHVARLVDAACRLPCLRHTPLKEIHKLALSMKETTYEPGQTLLRQGREVTDIHFIISGTVQLTYIPPHTAASSMQHIQAARNSSTGAALTTTVQAAGGSSSGYATDGGGGAAGAAAAGGDGAAAGGFAAAAAAGGGGGGGGAAAAVGSGAGPRVSIAEMLRAGQQCVQPAMVLGTRGPGAVLGDDAMRERRLAVGVVAASQVVTLRLAPQKFMAALDPLTLRLFGRLRQQQPPAQQRIIQDSLAETQGRPRTPQQHVDRDIILNQVYEGSHVPATLLRPGDEGYNDVHGLSCSGTASKPTWRTLKGSDTCWSCGGGSSSSATATVSSNGLEADIDICSLNGTSSGQPGKASVNGKGYDGTLRAHKASMHGSFQPRHSFPGSWSSLQGNSLHGSAASGSSSNAGCKHTAAAAELNPEDQAWEAGLPRGLTVDKCAGLPQSCSVHKLVEAIRDIDEFRRMQGSLLLPESGLVSSKLALNNTLLPAAAAAAAAAAAGAAGGRPASPAPAASTLNHGRLSCEPFAMGRARPGSPTHAAAGATADPAAAAAAATAAAAQMSTNSVHTELLESCGVAVLQLSVLPGQAAVSGSVFAGALDDVAAAWAAVTHDEGLQLVRWGATRWIMLAQLEPGTSKRAGLEGLADALLSASARMAGVVIRTQGLPALGLAAGMAGGSCFVQYEAGNFVCSISGRAYDAAAELCAAAAAAIPATASNGSSISHTALMVSDGVAGMLQTNFCLEACGGGYLLLSAHAALPGPGSSSKVASSSNLNRQTLGPGRHTMLATGALISSMTPKTPGTQGFAPRRGAGKIQNRRQMRRRFEALEEFLAGASDVLPPPPEHLLTQPPPAPRVTQYRGSAGDASGVVGGSKGVNFSASEGNKAATGGRGSNRVGKPNLRISVAEDGSSAGVCIGANTPGGTAKTPKFAANGYTSEALTPTLVMDSPQWGGAAAAVAVGSAVVAAEGAATDKTGWLTNRVSAATPKAGRASLANGSLASGAAAGGAADVAKGAATPSSTTSSNSRQSLRAQLWQEVHEMRDREASCAGGLAAAASRDFSQQSSMSSRSNNRTPKSPSATVGMGPFSSSGGLAAAGQSPFAGGAAAGTAGSSRALHLDFSSLSEPQSSGTLSADGMGSRSGAGANKGSTGAGKVQLKVTFQSPRNNRKSSLTSSANGSSSSSSHSITGRNTQPVHQLYRPSVFEGKKQPVPPQQQQQQQQLEAEASIQSVNSLSMWPDPATAAATTINVGSSTGTDAHRSTSPVAAGRAAAAALWKQQDQRQQALVMGACKAHGSFAAAEGYVAGLPEGLMSVNLSTAGLTRLPALNRLTQLDYLAASFNRLSGLPQLKPADATAVAAAAAAAADQVTSSSSNTSTGAASAAVQAVDAAMVASVDHDIEAAVGARLTRQMLMPGVSALPASIACLALAFNQLEQVPFELPAALPRLTALDLSHNKIKELPPTFGALSCLKLLFLGHNQLEQLPISCTRLFSLQTLNLDHNQLSQLPQGLQQLPSFVSLHACHNQLQQLPEGLSRMTGLRSLGLGDNMLQQLPGGLLVGLCSLTRLDLSGNSLKDEDLEAAAVQQSINGANYEASGPAAATAENPQEDTAEADSGSMSADTTAEAKLGATTGLHAAAPAPAAMARSRGHIGEPTAEQVLPALRVLDISHNHLQQLPLWLPQRLQHLSAASNRVQQLPGEVCSMLSGHLTHLNLQDNVLASVPQEMMLLEKLQVLALNGNPGMDPENLDEGQTGLVWVYKWMWSKKAAAASAAMRGAPVRQQHSR